MFNSTPISNMHAMPRVQAQEGEKKKKKSNKSSSRVGSFVAQQPSGINPRQSIFNPAQLLATLSLPLVLVWANSAQPIAQQARQLAPFPCSLTLPPFLSYPCGSELCGPASTTSVQHPPSSPLLVPLFLPSRGP